MRAPAFETSQARPSKIPPSVGTKSNIARAGGMARAASAVAPGELVPGRPSSRVGHMITRPMSMPRPDRGEQSVNCSISLSFVMPRCCPDRYFAGTITSGLTIVVPYDSVGVVGGVHRLRRRAELHASGD